MRVPKKICKVLENRKNFDFIFLEFLANESPKVAYELAVEEIQKYAPHFKHYESYDSYRVKLYRDYNDDVEVPEEIVTAVTRDIEDLMVKNMKKVGIRKKAYEMCVTQIQRYFPAYKPYRNYNSYRALQSINHKKKKNDRRQNRKNM